MWTRGVLGSGSRKRSAYPARIVHRGRGTRLAPALADAIRAAADRHRRRRRNRYRCAPAGVPQGGMAGGRHLRHPERQVAGARGTVRDRDGLRFSGHRGGGARRGHRHRGAGNRAGRGGRGAAGRTQRPDAKAHGLQLRAGEPHPRGVPPARTDRGRQSSASLRPRLPRPRPRHRARDAGGTHRPRGAPLVSHPMGGLGPEQRRPRVHRDDDPFDSLHQLDSIAARRPPRRLRALGQRPSLSCRMRLPHQRNPRLRRHGTMLPLAQSHQPYRAGAPPGANDPQWSRAAGRSSISA